MAPSPITVSIITFSGTPGRGLGVHFSQLTGAGTAFSGTGFGFHTGIQVRFHDLAPLAAAAASAKNMQQGMSAVGSGLSQWLGSRQTGAKTVTPAVQAQPGQIPMANAPAYQPPTSNYLQTNYSTPAPAQQQPPVGTYFMAPQK
jgi:hypothetical protein